MRIKLHLALILCLSVITINDAQAAEHTDEDRIRQLEANEYVEARNLWVWNATLADIWRYTEAHNEWVAEQQRLEEERIAQERAAYEASLSAEVQEPVAATVTPIDSTTGTSSGGSVWDALAQCESGGNWSINTGNGYYGGLQFSISSWQAVGGTGLPSEASREEQIARAESLRANGGWAHWPSCSAQLGL